MTDLRQAAQQALDAWDSPMGMKELCVAMDTFRAALEQQAEPVLLECVTCGTVYADGVPPQVSVKEPFGYLWPTGRHPEFRFTKQQLDGVDGMPLYTTPPQRQWVGLTDEEIGQIILQQEITLKNYVCVDKQTEFARAIEAKLKEKNSD